MTRASEAGAEVGEGAGKISASLSVLDKPEEEIELVLTQGFLLLAGLPAVAQDL
jgi:hypothetical protein